MTQEAPVTSQLSPWLTPLIYNLGRHGLMPLYFQQIEIVGQEHLPTSGPVILAPTHRSRWDALVVPYAAGRDITGRDLRFMVSINEIKGVQGWFIRRLGGFPIDPLQPAIASLRHGVGLLCQGETLVIFPEGAIFREPGIHPLKPGLARLALQAEAHQPGLGIQIVPIYIQYNQPIPQWRSQVQVKIGAPLAVSTYDSTALKPSAQHLTSDLAGALQQLLPAQRQELGQPCPSLSH